MDEIKSLWQGAQDTGSVPLLFGYTNTLGKVATNPWVSQIFY